MNEEMTKNYFRARQSQVGKNDMLTNIIVCLFVNSLHKLPSRLRTIVERH